jgi:HEAT repeats
MADEGHIIECSRCGRLHQVSADKIGQKIKCDCGKELAVDVPAGAGTGGGAASGDAASSGGGSGKASSDGTSGGGPHEGSGGVVGSVKRHWKAFIAAAVLIAVALAAVSFWRGPETSLGQGGAGGPGFGAAEKEDPEIHLHVLEDNARSDEHDIAVRTLLRLGDTTIVPRLCRMAQRSDLVSRPLVIRLLGKKGDEVALEVLRPLLSDTEPTIVYASAEAVARINTPLSESILRGVMQMPTRGREVLPSIAIVKNDLSNRILASALQNPALRTQAMDEIGTLRVNGCVAALVKLARNRTVLEADRVRSVETLSLIDTPEARRALLQLIDDDHISWKARQLLESQSRQ